MWGILDALAAPSMRIEHSEHADMLAFATCWSREAKFFVTPSPRPWLLLAPVRFWKFWHLGQTLQMSAHYIILIHYSCKYTTRAQSRSPSPLEGGCGRLFLPSSCTCNLGCRGAHMEVRSWMTWMARRLAPHARRPRRAMALG